MAQGIRHHSHEERSRIIEALVPMIKRHMGKDLLALAATGSFARGTDGRYSDIELIGIVRKLPRGKASIKFVHDGILIDIWFLTKREYLDDHRLKVRPSWSYAISSVLEPIFNETLIRQLHRTASNRGAEDRIAVIKERWPDLQEWSAKVLTAADTGNDNAVRYLFWQMAEKMCVILSLLNGRPFSTRAAAFAEVRDFQKLPINFNAFLNSHATKTSTDEIAETTVALFEGLERLLLESDIELYPPSLDAFVVEETPAMRLRCALHLDRIIRKARKVGHRIRRNLNFGTAVSS